MLLPLPVCWPILIGSGGVAGQRLVASETTGFKGLVTAVDALLSNVGWQLESFEVRVDREVLSHYV